MPDAPSRVFEAAAPLHVGVLCVAALLHVHHGRVAREIGARVASVVHVVVTMAMALVRIWIWRTGQCRAYHLACTTGWWIIVVMCYVGAVLHEDPTGHFRIVQSDPCAACSFLFLCMTAGMLHASVGPSASQSALCLASVTIACAAVVLSEPRVATVTFAVGCLTAHVLGYAMSAEIFAQKVRIVRFEDAAERLSCKKERSDYDLALAQKENRKALRALDEVRSVVRAFEHETALRPARRARRHSNPVVVGKPLFVLADEATGREARIAAATTTAELAAAEAVVSLDQLRGSESERDAGSGFDSDPDSDVEELRASTTELPHVLRRVAEATEVVSVPASSSLRSSDDSFQGRAAPDDAYEEAELRFRAPSDARGCKSALI